MYVITFDAFKAHVCILNGLTLFVCVSLSLCVHVSVPQQEMKVTHFQMSCISVGTSFSLVSPGIMAKPPTAKSEPPNVVRLRELLSCGNSTPSDHLETSERAVALFCDHSVLLTI